MGVQNHLHREQGIQVPLKIQRQRHTEQPAFKCSAFDTVWGLWRAEREEKAAAMGQNGQELGVGVGWVRKTVVA